MHRYYQLLHDSETWSVRQLDTKTLSIFENNCLGAILNIRLEDQVSIDEIQKSAKQQNSIENIIWQRRLTWFGQVSRLNNEICKNG